MTVMIPEPIASAAALEEFAGEIPAPTLDGLEAEAIRQPVQTMLFRHLWYDTGGTYAQSVKVGTKEWYRWARGTKFSGWRRGELNDDGKKSITLLVPLTGAQATKQAAGTNPLAAAVRWASQQAHRLQAAEMIGDA